MPTMHLDALSTTALALLLLAIGSQLKKRSRWLTRLCVPSPVIAGFGFAFLVWLLRDRGWLDIGLDTSLQTPLMVAFFTTVGLGGSLGLLRKGGKTLLVYLAACWALAILQNLIGAGSAGLFGLDPLLGIMAGAVSLEGGFGAAAAFGPVAEGLGAQGATTVALASATFGMVAGGLLGSPVARWLIERNRLLVRAESDSELEALGQQEQRQHAVTALDGNLLLRLLTCVLLVMVLGFWLGDALQERLGLVLPSYVGAMFIAIVLRNLDDRLGWLRIPDHAIGTLGDVCLGIFLTMAMMSLKFWELENLGLPLLGVLFIQVVALLLLTIFVLFRLLGRNYDAAVLCAGFLGHGLGATPNAVANMGAVCEHYRVFSRKAFIIVPLCGAVLIDLVAIPAITWFINAFS
ncbi:MULTISPECIES: sodium/glutamate symporter [Pseudomonas aeruginosa group]|uniref:sodium/glutamate symporter n=1 Tax=Pseudomonas aeruginosa group TaxID=136841 RepID=UPI00071B9F1B|nr:MULTISPECIES: sodium/glutamate symporter [Pseudomonas aeruginosa group]KSC45744.1 sodium/glutamate symporter [Pseudomonas paraeruginosa]KSL07413.1 sodium/glutamate symporter [Pseudomonas aeruginosa]MBH8717006.1 sodium/glutamate symporter [Pseudomonas aeruginosa]MBI8117651.1 sodium/glutamate symporter [Pseudomonas aeruginosa]OKR44089.1 sodium/glutamate symporter [Pseudomonas aeruginosa]